MFVKSEIFLKNHVTPNTEGTMLNSALHYRNKLHLKHIKIETTYFVL